uniref:Pre-mRNA-splicing factor 18 n=1 Tax=Blastobotrys adeninivorans TaxID=409370 RepID=A0A060SWP7_BLAAD
MDFSALLAKEIAKKRAEAGEGAQSKQINRGQLAKQQEQEYWREQEEARQRKEQREKRKREQEEQEREELRIKREKLRKRSAKNDDSNAGTDSDSPVPVKEVIDELRQLSEPVTLFGESDNDRFKRLQKIKRRKEIERIRAEEKKREEGVEFEIDPQDIRDNVEKVNLQVRAYLRYLLALWKEVLERNMAKDDDSDGGLEILHQTEDEVEILLNRMRDKKLEPTVVTSVSTMLHYIQQKNYRLANDSYIKMSIGTAAWPVGIVSVGLHDRAPEERFSGGNDDAQIMKDESTRRWLTAVKRLLTFAEKNKLA